MLPMTMNRNEFKILLTLSLQVMAYTHIYKTFINTTLFRYREKYAFKQWMGSKCSEF